MKTWFTVSHVDFFNNDLTNHVVYASSWKNALTIGLSRVYDCSIEKAFETVHALPDDLEEAKNLAYDAHDYQFEVAPMTVQEMNLIKESCK